MIASGSQFHSALICLAKELFRYLSQVRAGEELVVTDRGRPIAKIVPIRAGEVRVPAHIALLERAGGIRMGTGKLPKGFWDVPRPLDTDSSVVKALLEERRSSR